MATENLSNLRQKLDEINRQILDLLSERGKVVLGIGEEKRESGRTSAYDSKREEEIFEYLTKHNKGPYDDEMIIRIFKQIFEESTSLQEKIIKRKNG